MWCVADYLWAPTWHLIWQGTVDFAALRPSQYYKYCHTEMYCWDILQHHSPGCFCSGYGGCCKAWRDLSFANYSMYRLSHAKRGVKIQSNAPFIYVAGRMPESTPTDVAIRLNKSGRKKMNSRSSFRHAHSACFDEVFIPKGKWYRLLMWRFSAALLTYFSLAIAPVLSRPATRNQNSSVLLLLLLVELPRFRLLQGPNVCQSSSNPESGFRT